VLTLATGGGAGYAPVAPGTFGSAVGVLCYLPLAPLGAVAVLGTALVLLVVGTWAADETERIYGKKDDGRIVIDEVVGQLVTLAPLTLLADPPWELRGAVLVVAGFFVFRLFDIWKPGPARMAERRLAGGLGVMMDDVVAGIFSAVVMAGAAWLLGAASA
jgi:phosphatidylglycerophosphatase A